MLITIALMPALANIKGQQYNIYKKIKYRQ